MKNITLLELFSGIGGFTLGLKNSGFNIEKHYFSEVDKHAIANYKYNFKHAEYIGSVTNVRNIIRTINENRKPTDRLGITFGSPCQDFSLAGKGKGLGGSKSSLIKYAIFLIKWLKPDFFIWENVKGAYSTNAGADYWAIIQAFTNLDGYRCETQLLNTSWFLPQNRERIYLIGHLTGRSEFGVFPIGEANFIYNEAGTATESIQQSASTLTAQSYEKWRGNYIEINSNTKKGYEIATENDSINFSVPSSKTRRGRVGVGVAQTLDTQCNQGVMVKQLNDSKESGGTQPYQQNRVYDISGISPALSVGNGYNSGMPNVATNKIRRLTEIECERLQGFPDDWTKYGLYLDNKIEKRINRKKKFTHPDLWLKIYLKAAAKYSRTMLEIPKTQRYKMCGNAVTVEVVKQIGLKIKLTN